MIATRPFNRLPIVFLLIFFNLRMWRTAFPDLRSEPRRTFAQNTQQEVCRGLTPPNCRAVNKEIYPLEACSDAVLIQTLRKTRRFYSVYRRITVRR